MLVLIAQKNYFRFSTRLSSISSFRAHRNLFFFSSYIYNICVYICIFINTVLSCRVSEHRDHPLYLSHFAVLFARSLALAHFFVSILLYTFVSMSHFVVYSYCDSMKHIFKLYQSVPQSPCLNIRTYCGRPRNQLKSIGEPATAAY